MKKEIKNLKKEIEEYKAAEETSRLMFDAETNELWAESAERGYKPSRTLHCVSADMRQNWSGAIEVTEGNVKEFIEENWYRWKANKGGWTSISYNKYKELVAAGKTKHHADLKSNTAHEIVYDGRTYTEENYYAAYGYTWQQHANGQTWYYMTDEGDKLRVNANGRTWCYMTGEGDKKRGV